MKYVFNYLILLKIFIYIVFAIDFLVGLAYNFFVKQIIV